jgi:hypothetical protein
MTWVDLRANYRSNAPPPKSKVVLLNPNRIIIPLSFMANLTGTWLGTYWQDDRPTRFEMSIAQGGNALSGNILDDGNLGEAIGRNVQFFKRYIGFSQGNILYQGLLSENENLMQGEWTLKMSLPVYGEMTDSGRWEATRSENDLSNELTQYLAKKKELSLVSSVL